MPDFDRAEPLYLRALAIREKHFGPTNHITGETLSDLALLYHDHGDFRKAEPLSLRVVPIFEQHYGLEHEQLASLLNKPWRSLRAELAWHLAGGAVGL